jgi:hypothetical protein
LIVIVFINNASMSVNFQTGLEPFYSLGIFGNKNSRQNYRGKNAYGSGERTIPVQSAYSEQAPA